MGGRQDLGGVEGDREGRVDGKEKRFVALPPVLDDRDVRRASCRRHLHVVTTLWTHNNAASFRAPHGARDSGAWHFPAAPPGLGGFCGCGKPHVPHGTGATVGLGEEDTNETTDLCLGLLGRRHRSRKALSRRTRAACGNQKSKIGQVMRKSGFKFPITLGSQGLITWPRFPTWGEGHLPVSFWHSGLCCRPSSRVLTSIQAVAAFWPQPDPRPCGPSRG